MPQIDANKTASRQAVRTVNKGRAKRVRKARAELSKPAPKGTPRATTLPTTRGPAHLVAQGRSQAVTKKRVVAKAKSLQKTGGSLKAKEKTIHELARAGVLPDKYLSGIDQRDRDDATRAELSARVQRIIDKSAPKPQPGSLAERIETAEAKRAKSPAAQKTYEDALKKIPTESRSRSKLASAVGGAPGGLLRSAGALIEGTYKDPIGVPTKTAKQGALAVAALPAGVVGLATHPVKTAEAAVDDYAKRNDETYDEKLARVRKEGGFAEAADIATALSLGGGAAAKGALIAKAPARAAKLLSGGAKATPKKGGPVRYGIGRAVDARKAAKYERKVSKGQPLTALEHEALQANRKAGRVVAVVPRRSGRKIAKVVADARGKAIAGLKYDSAKGPFSKLAKEKYNLNKDEAQALWLGTEVGIRDADTARTVAGALREKMAAERGDYTPTGWEKDMDVIAQIDKILEHPEKHFTPKFAAAMDNLRTHAQEIADLEPQFKTQTKENRRRAAQAYALGLERGEGAEVPGVGPIPPIPPIPARPPIGPLEAPFSRIKVGKKKYEFEDLPEYVHDYQPSAEGINAKTFYHGTNTKDLKPEDLDGTQTQIDSLFGQGVYLTDDRHTAQTYAAARSKRRGEPTVYETKLHVKNPLDMDSRADPVFHSLLNKQAKSLGHLGGNMNDPDPFIIDEMAKMLEEKAGKHTNADLYDAFRSAVIDYANDYGLSRGDLTEYFQDLASDLRGAGFDALTHVGGLRAGKGVRKHQVAILLDPANTGNLRNVDRQAETFDVAPDAPKGIIEATSYANAPRTARAPKGDAVPAVPGTAGSPALPPLKYADETDAEFNARIDEAAVKAGLAQPTYFRSEKQQGLTSDFGARTVGGGNAKSTGKTYEGKNLRQGIFDTTFDQFIRGYAHNVKAIHNYPLVVKLDEKNRLRSFSPDDQPQGKELGALMNDVNRAEPRLQKDSVVFVNKGIFEKALDDAPDSGEFDTPDDAANAQAREAMKGAVVKPGETVDPEFLQTHGWVAWPKEALRELEAELTSGTAAGRTADILKGSASKAILLTGNLPWLALQTASETATAGIASKGRALTPRNAIGTARWWGAMNHTQRTHVATELGLGATGSDTQAIKLGATTNNRLVDAWRDFKSEDFWHRPRALAAGKPISSAMNPVQWMRAADQGKTNVTRLLLAHSELTKHVSPEGTSALAGALGGMAKFGKDADRLLPVFKKPAPEQLEFLQKNPELLEQMGENVSTAMGDWTSMTARERKVANRLVMFWPFVRYSTRLLFHTLPVDHPAVTSVLAELGQLTAEEYRSVFGDDDLPWNMGRVYFGKTGESKYIDLARANPALNQVVQAAARIGTSSSNLPGVVTGSLPPYGQWLVDQATGVNTFKGRPLRFNGDTDPFWNKPTDIGLEDRGQLALAQIQSLFSPAREAMTRLHPESQSDESSLAFPQAMNYKSSKEIKGNGEDARIRRQVARNAEANEAFAKENNGGLLDIAFGPLVPRESRDKVSADERRQIKTAKAKQAKTAAERKAYRDSHGGKNKPKPKGFSSAGNSGF